MSGLLPGAPAVAGTALRPPRLRPWVVGLALVVLADAGTFLAVFDGRLPYSYQYDITPENEARLRQLVNQVYMSWPDRRRVMELLVAVKFDIGRQALPTLTEYMGHESPRMRRIALWGIAALEDQTATPAVVAALDDPDSPVVFTALMTLGDLGDRQALDRMVAALDHPDFRVRAAAALNVGLVGPRPQDVEALIAHVEDPNHQVGRTIQQTLSEVCHVNPAFLGRSRLLWEEWWNQTGRESVALPPT